MRIVVQRVKRASVTVSNAVVGKIDKGLMVLVGVCPEDTEDDCSKVAKKITGMRLWPDETGQQQWKSSVRDIKGKVLVVSQFTLFAKVTKGTKPDFHGAAKGEHAKALYEEVMRLVAQNMHNGAADVEAGVFGAMMDVELINDGPVTIQYDSRQ